MRNDCSSESEGGCYGGEGHESASSALSHCGLKNVSGITDCCKGRRKHAGTVNGEPCRWMYYKDYIKEFEEVTKVA